MQGMRTERYLVRRCRVFGIFMILYVAAFCSSASSQTSAAVELRGTAPPAWITWLVLNDLNTHNFDPDSLTLEPRVIETPPPGLITAVDVSHDGVADWLLDYGAVGAATWCGTGGCLNRLYVSGNDGELIRAFDGQVGTMMIVPGRGSAKVEIDVHRLYCNNSPGACRFAFTWDASDRALMPTLASDGVGLLVDGGYPAIGDDGAGEGWRIDPPISIAEALLPMRIPCPSSDGAELADAVRSGQARRSADLNGDGIADWIVIPPTACDGISEPGYAVWVSEAETFRSAMVSVPDHIAIISLRGPQPVLIDALRCLDKIECPGQRMAWSSGRSAFVPE